MVERRRGARLLLQPRELFVVAGEMLRQDFDGDGAVELIVVREVDEAHPPFAQLADGLVRPNALFHRRRGHGVPLIRIVTKAVSGIATYL